MGLWTSKGRCDSTESGGFGCGHCPETARCILNTLQRGRMDADAPQVVHLPPADAGQPLRVTCEPADAIYVVRAGAVKRLTGQRNREAHPIGFHLRGEVIGPLFDAMAELPDVVVALEPTRLYRVRLNHFCLGARQRFLQWRSACLRDEFGFHVGLASCTPPQRLAAFLLRLSARGNSAAFRLPIPYSDIAAYLSLAPTQLRASFLLFVGCGWLQVESDHHLRIRDVRALQRLSGD